jgi:nucleoside-diphosphate-sugar epimerase
MKYFTTGGAGFIGSNLVDRLLAWSHMVTAHDNLSTDRREFLPKAVQTSDPQLVGGGLLRSTALQRALICCSWPGSAIALEHVVQMFPPQLVAEAMRSLMAEEK